MRRVMALVCLAALVACRGTSGSVEDLCAAVRGDQLSATVFSGFDPSDTERALQQLTTARLTLGTYRDAAPSEVRDDIDVEIAYVQDLIDSLTALQDPDPARSVETVRQVTAGHPKVADAAATLAAFSQEHCAG